MSRGKSSRPQPALWGLLVLLIGAASGAGFLARLGYPFELASHFRPQYAALSALMAVVLLGLGRWRWMFAAFALSVTNAIAAMSPFFILAPTLDGDDEARMARVVWFNLHGERTALAGFSAWTATLDPTPDVIALTEWPDDTNPEAFWPGYETCVASGNGGDQASSDTASSSTGVMLLAKGACPPRFEQLESPVPDAAARALWNDELTVVAVHAPRPVDLMGLARGPSSWLAAGQVRLRDTVIDVAAQSARVEELAVLIGDFNAAPWSPVALTIATGGLYRVDCGAPWRSTWLSDLPVLGLPIDHAYVREGMAADCEVGPAMGSDHRPLLVDVSGPVDRGD